MTSNWFERHPRTTIVVGLMVSLLILDVLFANAYKLIAGHPWAQDYISVAHQFRSYPHVYHHGFKKNASVDNAQYGFLKYKVRTNSLGFIDGRIRDIALETDKHRIVFMGDSYTEGMGVPYNSTFVGIIDSLLSQQGIEVLNAASGGYSPIVYWRKTKYIIEEMGLDFDEMIVFLDLSDARDETMRYFLDDSLNVRYQNDSAYYAQIDKHRRSFGDLIRRNTIATIALLTEVRRYRYLVQKDQQYGINSDNSLWTIREEDYKAFGEAGLESMKFYMDKLYDLLEAHGISLTVAVYPWPDQVYYFDFMSIQVSFWKEWCAGEKVKFIDCFPYFVKGSTQEEREEIIEKYYIRYDTHFNENGHRLIADIFLDSYGNE